MSQFHNVTMLRTILFITVLLFFEHMKLDKSRFKKRTSNFLNLDWLIFFIGNFVSVQIQKNSLPNFESGPIQISKKYIENFETGLVQIQKKYIKFFEAGLVDILYHHF